MPETKDPPDISIVIPSRDHPDRLGALLRSIRDHLPADVAIEILVVDDGSTMDLGPVCKAHEARHLRVETSRGPAHARNHGAANARGPLLLLFDDDVVCPPGLVERIRDTFGDDPEAISLSFFNQSYETDDNTVKNYGAAIEHYWMQMNMEGDGAIVSIPGFTTRNAAVRKAAFDAIEGYDTFFSTNAHEDYDFGVRLAFHGKTLLSREPVVYHNFPDSLRRVLRNYWVRVRLFVPYMLKHKPVLYKAQSSSPEAALRLLGGLAVVFFVLALLPVPDTRVWAAAFFAAIAIYGFCIRGFLLCARRWSGSWAFPAKAFCIHYLTSLVVTVGSAWASLVYLVTLQKHLLKSPIR